MTNFLSIGIALISLAAVIGCSGAENPLQGTWQGNVEISGALTAQQFAFDTDIPAPNLAQREPTTQAAKLTLQFLGDDQLKLTTEPLPEVSHFPPQEQTATYEVLEELPDQVRLRVSLPEGARELQLRFTGPETLTVTELRGNPRVLPVAMTRAQE